VRFDDFVPVNNCIIGTGFPDVARLPQRTVRFFRWSGGVLTGDNVFDIVLIKEIPEGMVASSRFRAEKNQVT
jgi:hypothetical protein